MSKIMVCGRGGSGKSTLVTLLAQVLGEQGKVLVVDTDESNLGLNKMLGQEPPGEPLAAGPARKNIAELAGGIIRQAG